MEQFFSTDKINDIDVIRLSFNEINLEEREQLKKDLVSVLAAGTQKFIIDFSKVGFLSSLVIATIVFFAKEVRNKGGDVKLCFLSKEARSVFEVTQLNKIFELYNTDQDAAASF